MPHDLDSVDIRLLELLQDDDRRSYADLGAEVGLSISGVNARLKKLVASGVIRRFTAQVDPVEVGLDLCAFIQIVLERPEHDRGFLEAVAEIPAILECHHVTGDYSYLLKVRVASTAELEKVISTRIKSLPGVARSHTAIALSSPKETTALDLRSLADR
jgi:Lrp/AsnC family leucine-responsive transcriptional regulator